jgi:hypothetical protein
MRVLITGASGSGTSTLGTALARVMGAQFLDADDYFWLPTDPPYRERSAHEDRLSRILCALECHKHSVVSGSVMGWGEVLENSFSAVIFLQLDTAIRIERLRRREAERFGHANPEFLEWAAQYDSGPPEGRSLAKHNEWLTVRSCPVIRLAGELSTADQIRAVASQLPVRFDLP